jgi:predicted XRE-type DNA-binding protein
MNAIQNLERRLQLAIPGLHSKLEVPKTPTGKYWLDLVLDGHTVTVEWQASMGFGVSSSLSEPIYGEKPEEIHDSVDDVFERIKVLLETKTFTHPPTAVMLQHLRERLGLPQAEIAERLGITQSSVSKLERREDMQIRTLARYIAALGGIMEIFVRFPGGGESLRIGQFDGDGDEMPI